VDANCCYALWLVSARIGWLLPRLVHEQGFYTAKTTRFPHFKVCEGRFAVGAYGFAGKAVFRQSRI
jgi:hypothetical protein